MARQGVILGSLLAVGAVGCAKDVEKPTPPDMKELVLAYENPRGTFDDSSVNTVLDTVGAVIQNLDELGVTTQLDTMFEQLQEATAEEDPGATPQTEVETDGRTIRIEGEGFFEIERICDGWGPEPVADSANGRLILNVNVTDLRVDPVMWLTTNACRYLEDGLPVELDAGSRRDVGDLRIFVGDNLALDKVGTTPILIDVDVTAGVDAEGSGATVPVDFDLRLDPDGSSFETRVGLSDGDLVIGTSNDEIVSVRGGNGLFTCSGSLCTNETGDEVNL